MNLQQNISALSLPRLIIINSQLDNLKYADIGLLLSSSIEHSISKKHLAMIANDALDEIIKKNISHDQNIGDYIALSNIGILFEPSLCLNLQEKFRIWTKTFTLIINNSEGTITNNIFYLANAKTESYSINLSNIPYNIISYEI